MTTKEDLHQLIERLSEGDLEAAARALSDPFLLGLLATPEGEEPLTKEEIVGLMEAQRDIEAGRVKSFSNIEDLLSDLREAPAKSARKGVGNAAAKKKLKT